MISEKKENINYANNTKTFSMVFYPESHRDIKKIISQKKNFIFQGNKKSYGDVGSNNHMLVSMKNFNKIIHFDKKKGIVEAESGLLLKDLLEIIVPAGWFIPVTPGTKYVSLGGMVANNVHGKNTKKNQIKYCVKKINLITPKNKEIICSKKINKKLFDLTIGGYGLTGAIVTITLQLKKILSENIEQKIIEFKNFKEFYSISKINKNFEYSVCWIDNFTEDNIKGLYFLGNHSKQNKPPKIKLISAKIMGPLFLIMFRIIFSNFYFPKLMTLIFRNYKKRIYNKICHYNEYFYPQDNMPYWNKIYGSNGFVALQFLIPNNKFRKILGEISNFLKENKIFSDFVILKKFNESGKYLNFSGSGYSISFHFIKDKKYESLKRFINNLFKKYKIKVNFSKDLMTDKNNAHNYREFKSFKKNLLNIDSRKKMSSLFSKRLGI